MVNTRFSQCMNNTPLEHEVTLTNSFLEEGSYNNMKPVIEERNYFHAQIDMRSSYQVIEDIKQKLTPRQIELFGKTCFGHFLKLEGLAFSAKLVHRILLRLLISPEEDTSLHFRLGDKHCSFRLQDFALITGLDCRKFDSRKPKLSDRFRDEFFNGRERVSTEEITRVFKAYSGNSDGDAVKLAQLYLLEKFLLSKRSKISYDNLFIELVDDSAEFDRFPWGRFVYDFTVSSMKLVMKTEAERSGGFRTYFLKGFPHALQFWAFECLPIVRERFGRRIGFDMPRMFNWALIRKPTEKEVEDALNSGEFPVERELQRRDEELCKDYFRFFLKKWRSKNGKSKNGSEVCIEEDGDDDDKMHDNAARSDDSPADPILKSPARTLQPSLEKWNSVKPTFLMPSSYQVITEIKSKLTRRQTDIFKQTCFGHFLKLQRLRLSRQLIHQILLRQSERPIDESSMHFRIFGEDHEFSLRDFELITGLDCREYDAPAGALEAKPSDRLRNKYFRGTNRASIADIAQAFREYSGNSDGDAVKLALLYLLEAFLLSKPPNIASDNDFIGLVDDTGEFDRFPWGRYVYGYTVRSMKGAMEARAEKHGGSTGYILRGFPQALQFWAFEHLAVIRERIGRRLGFDGPLMLNWGLNKLLRNEELESIFNGSEVKNLKESERKRKRTVFKDESLKRDAENAILNGTSHEKNHNDDDDIDDDDDDDGDDGDDDEEIRALVKKEIKSILGIEISEAVCLLKDEVRARLMTETTKQQKYFTATDIDERDERPPRIKSTQGTDNIRCFTVDLSEHPDRVEKAEFDKWTEVGLERNNKLMTETTKQQKYFTATDIDERDKRPPQIKSTQGTDNIICFTIDLFEHPDSVEKAEFDKRTEVGLERNNKLMTETTNNVVSKRHRIQGTNDIPCFTADLFEHPNDDEKAEFDEWIEVGLKRNKKNKYSDISNEINPAFDFEIMKCDKKEWFVSLNETAQWLSSSHIDVALHFMRKKKANYPELFKHRCTIADTLFHARLSWRYSDFKRDPQAFLWDKEPFVQNTVRGIEPSHSLPWLGVDFIYVPVNAGQKHWFLAVLDLKKRRLDIYDSYHAAKHDLDIALACQPIAEMVPWLLKSMGFFDGKNDVFVLNGSTEPWDVELVRAIPQQANGGDCGMFMLKFTEFLMQGESLEKCGGEAISFFRNKMAVELYVYGKKTATTE